MARVAVITGAASGIGAAIAERFHADGMTVVGVDLNQPQAEYITKGIVADLTDAGAAVQTIADVVAEFGGVDVLVNSAGIAILDPATDVPEDHWRKVLDVNINGTWFITQAAGRVMVERGWGRVINLASQAAVIGLENHAAYCTSKAAITGLTRALSLEWAPRGVTVNAIAPTVVETPLGKAAWAGEKGEKAKAAIPTQRFAQPEEVAAMASYLASDEAGMVTGTTMLIDGGFTTV